MCDPSSRSRSQATHLEMNKAGLSRQVHIFILEKPFSFRHWEFLLFFPNISSVSALHLTGGAFTSQHPLVVLPPLPLCSLCTLGNLSVAPNPSCWGLPDPCSPNRHPTMLPPLQEGAFPRTDPSRKELGALTLLCLEGVPGDLVN